MRFEIQPPDNVIEASYSADPDDVSVVSIRITAKRDDPPGPQDREDLSDLTGIRFAVRTDLTTNPSAVTPQAYSFRDWQMQREGGEFVALRRTPPGEEDGVAGAEPPDEGWTFFLRDVEVTEGAGTATIDVVEERSGKPGPTRTLTLRKVHPSLRIDYFHVTDNTWAPEEPEESEEPKRLVMPGETLLDATTSSASPVTLSWATTAADRVSLFGPRINRSSLGDRGGEVGDDDSVEVEPRTTSVYTLVASNATAHTVAQVTVTVADQTILPNLKVESLVEVQLLENADPELMNVGTVDTAQLLASLMVGSPSVRSENVLLENRTRGTDPLLTMRVLEQWDEDEVGWEEVNLRLVRAGQDADRWRYDLSVEFKDEVPRALLDRNGHWRTSSDAALKERVEDLPSVLDGVRQLRPARFRWKGETEKTDAEADVGFIAQEVGELFPHLVGTTTGVDGEPMLNLAYSGFGVLAVAAIKELADQSDERIAALERTVADLTRRQNVSAVDRHGEP